VVSDDTVKESLIKLLTCSLEFEILSPIGSPNSIYHNFDTDGYKILKVGDIEIHCHCCWKTQIIDKSKEWL